MIVDFRSFISLSRFFGRVACKMQIRYYFNGHRNLHAHTLTSAASCWYCVCRGIGAPALMAAKRRVLTSGETVGQYGCRCFWSPRTSFIGVVTVWHEAYAFERSILTLYETKRNNTELHRTKEMLTIACVRVVCK